MPNTTWDANRWSLEEADVLGKHAVLRASADESARHVRGLYVTFLLFAFYVAVIVFSTTDEQLLRETGARLPLLNVELPLLGFYIFIPWLVLIFHIHLLNQFFLLSRKLHNLNRAIASLPDDIQRTHRELPFPLLFSHMLVGRHYPSLLRWAFSAAVIITVVVIPVALLLAIQWKFLPYHSSWITLDHQIVVVLALLFLWALWPRMAARSGRLRWWWRSSYRFTVLGEDVRLIRPRTRRQRRQMRSMLSPTVVVLVFSLALLVPPENGIEVFLGYQPWLDILHRNLDLHEKTLMEQEPPPELIAAYKTEGEPPEKVWLDHGKPLDLQRRDLRNVDLSNATLWDVDLRYANLQGAGLREAELQGANLEGAQLQGAKLQSAKLQGASLERAELQGADLVGAQLQGANLWKAPLQGANLERAELQGAYLAEAQLQGADLMDADLQGAGLVGAQLQGAYLAVAELQGAYLAAAELQGANLREAQLQGANLWKAQLQGADLRYAQLQGANLRGANLQGANLRGANLQGANLREANLQGANLREATVFGTNFAEADISLADLRGLHAAPIGWDWNDFNDPFKRIEKLESTLTSDAESWPERALERTQEALSHFWDVAFDPPLNEPLPSPLQAPGAMYNQCDLFADWPPPPSIDAFEKDRAALLANLSCNDTHIAQAMIERATGAKSTALALLDKAAECPALARTLEELDEKTREKLKHLAQKKKEPIATEPSGSAAADAPPPPQKKNDKP